MFLSVFSECAVGDRNAKVTGEDAGQETTPRQLMDPGNQHAGFSEDWHGTRQNEHGGTIASVDFPHPC